MASFRKRNGKWQVRISWYEGSKRKYLAKNGFLTKIEAMKFANEYEAKKYDGTITNSSVTFADYFKDWFEIYKKNKIALSTSNRYIVTYNLIKKYFPNQKLSNIKRYDYQIFINDFGQTHAPDTVQKTHSTIRACIKSAKIDKIISNDFTENIELVWNEDKKYKVDYLNVKEIKQLVSYILDKLNPDYTTYYMILTAIFTGARLSEIAGLTWDDINFNWKTININKTWNYRINNLAPTKNKSSIRIIKINDILVDSLKNLKTNKTKFVFENSSNSIPTSNGVNKTLRACLKHLNINRLGYHFHSIRHSHVALLLYYGVDIYAISKRLGHANLTTTTKKYAYLIDELQQKSDEHITTTLDNLLPKNDKIKLSGD